MSVTAKVAIVTGALGGIGAATARLLAEGGWHVVATDLVDTGSADLVAELNALGPRATFVAADLVDEDQARAVVERAIDRFGRLDGAFDNAGIAQRGKPLVDLTSDEFDAVMRVNILGVFHCVKHQMLAMADGDGGSIVITSSGLGVTAFPNCAEYVTSKHALCGLTRAAAVEGAPRGIRVNAILPGSIRSPMAESLFGSLAAEQRAGRIHLLERLGEPGEVGRAVRWLLSDEASFMTGGLIPVDGGTTAGRRV